jgi:hypothetical protein
VRQAACMPAGRFGARLAMRTTTLWLVGLVTVGFLATLWPLPTAIAHETVEAARAQGAALSDEAAAQLAETVASGLWPWWIANLAVLVLGATFLFQESRPQGKGSASGCSRSYLPVLHLHGARWLQVPMAWPSFRGNTSWGIASSRKAALARRSLSSIASSA